jgi:hypothetical protein
MKTRKKVLYGVLIFIILALTGAAVYINSLLPILTGYAAKNLCSDVFISGRQQAEVESTDLNFSLIKYTRNRVDFIGKSVVSRFLWKKSKAIYRDGFGVTLIRDIPEDTIRSEMFPANTESGYQQDTILWPLGDVVKDTVTGINAIALEEITKRLITDNAYKGNAFAFIVLHKGIPVAEAYKPQFSQKTRFLSWSMAKSFTNSIVGMLVKEGKMDIARPADIAGWKNDGRSRITLNDLLQMQSGLKWNEDYGSRSDVNLMLHNEGNMAQYAFGQPSEFPAGTHWFYSSGTANIITYLIKKLFPDDSSYYSFVHNRFFNRIGIPDAVFEVDPSGNFVGSSYIYATARDYARFGLLYLNDGVFNGERVLPEGWVKYTTTPASGSNGEYGALFWLNLGKKYPSAPEDMFSCQGHDGQQIFIIPSRELVLVVLGYSPRSKGGMDFDRLLKDVLVTLK